MTDNSNVYVETKPNHFVGPYVSITIRTKTKDANNIDINKLRWRIEGMIRELNK